MSQGTSQDILKLSNEARAAQIKVNLAAFKLDGKTADIYTELIVTELNYLEKISFLFDTDQGAAQRKALLAAYDSPAYQKLSEPEKAKYYSKSEMELILNKLDELRNNQKSSLSQSLFFEHPEQWVKHFERFERDYANYIALLGSKTSPRMVDNKVKYGLENLDSILKEPFQRVGRYPMTYGALVEKLPNDHPNKKTFEEVGEKISLFAKNVNALMAKPPTDVPPPPAPPSPMRDINIAPVPSPLGLDVLTLSELISKNTPDKFQPLLKQWTFSRTSWGETYEKGRQMQITYHIARFLNEPNKLTIEDLKELLLASKSGSVGWGHGRIRQMSTNRHITEDPAAIAELKMLKSLAAQLNDTSNPLQPLLEKKMGTEMAKDPLEKLIILKGCLVALQEKHHGDYDKMGALCHVMIKKIDEIVTQMGITSPNLASSDFCKKEYLVFKLQYDFKESPKVKPELK